MREYHMWEIATKNYFDDQYVRNGGVRVDWKKKSPGTPAASHVARVKEQLSVFSASVPKEVIDIIDRARSQVNTAKHEVEFFVTEIDYRDLVAAVSNFWETLSLFEEFTPPRRMVV